MEVSEYLDISQFLLHGKYPHQTTDNKLPLAIRKNLKANFRRKCKLYSAEVSSEGKLTMVYRKSDKTILAKPFMNMVLEEYHDNKFSGGHFGRFKTMSKIQETYYWNGMKDDISDYIQKCEKCQKVNPKMNAEKPELHPIPVPNGCWKLVTIDLVGPLNETKNRNRYIIAATDHFTKWSEAKGIPFKNMEESCKFLREIICRNGVMQQLDSDQGREFVNSIIADLTEYTGIHHRISSAYHPQTQGQREKDNRTLKEGLSKLVNEYQDDWDELILPFLHAYHASIHFSTKVAPFEAWFGRKPNWSICTNQENEEANPNSVEEIFNRMEIPRDKIDVNIKASQARNKKYFDKKHCDPEKKQKLSIGSKFHLTNPQRLNRKGDKLAPIWKGPYEVVGIGKKGRITIKNLHNDKVLKCSYKMSLCKLICSSEKESKEAIAAGNDDSSVEVEEIESSIEKKESKVNLEALPQLIRNEIGMKFGWIKFENIRLKTPSHSGPKKTKEIVGDGNCFFRCISYAIAGTERHHISVRNLVVDHMVNNFNPFLEEYLGRNVQEYAKNNSLTADGRWASDAEIFATAHMLAVDINTWTSHGTSGKKWVKFPASLTFEGSSQYCINLDHKKGVHYNLVLK